MATRPRPRDLERELPRLASTPAPKHFADSVLRRIGLTDSFCSVASALGDVFVAYNRRGICAVARASDRAGFERWFRERFGRPAVFAPQPPQPLRQALETGNTRSLRFDLRGLSPFEIAVLRKATEIPRGETRPYAWVAREIGRPKAVRAVGTALGKNPIPLLIPCHRVVRSDGSIGEYGLGGSTNKRRVLEAEGAPVTEIAGLGRRGIHFYGCRTTRIYCFPLCTSARRMAERNRVTFRSAADARSAGFRPCKRCRPALAS